MRYLIVIACILSLSCERKVTFSEADYRQLVEVVADNETQFEMLETRLKATDANYNSLSRTKFALIMETLRPLNSIFDRLSEMKRLELTVHERQIQLIKNWKTLDSLREEAYSIIENQHEDFGISEHQLPKLLKSFKEEPDKIDQLWQETIQVSSSSVLNELSLIALEELFYRMMVENINVSYLVASRNGMWFDNYFPVVQTNQSAYRLGDTIRAKISIGTYSDKIDPKTVVFKINGDQYQLGNDGIINYHKVVRTLKDHSIESSIIMTHPITGETIESLGTFNFIVY